MIKITLEQLCSKLPQLRRSGAEDFLLLLSCQPSPHSPMLGTNAAEEERSCHRSRLAHFHLTDVRFSDLIFFVRSTHETGLEDAKFHYKKIMPWRQEAVELFWGALPLWHPWCNLRLLVLRGDRSRLLASQRSPSRSVSHHHVCASPTKWAEVNSVMV